MKGAQLREAVRMVEGQHDVPPKLRLQWLEHTLPFHTNTKDRLTIQSGMRRVKAQQKQPKYSVFFRITKLRTWAFEEEQEQEEKTLVDLVIMRLRLTTLMRSGDLANMVWGLFMMDNKYYIKTTNKQGKLMTFMVAGKTLQSIKSYLINHQDHPGLFLLRHLTDTKKYLGAERVAKRTLNIMKQCDIDISIFGAHSLRGATATHLLEEGMDKENIKNRGGWSSMQTLDQYYARLHNSQDWENSLGGHASAGIVLTCAVPPPTPFHSKPTKEGEGGKGEGGGHSTRQHIERPGNFEELVLPGYLPLLSTTPST